MRRYHAGPNMISLSRFDLVNDFFVLLLALRLAPAIALRALAAVRPVYVVIHACLCDRYSPGSICASLLCHLLGVAR